MFFVFIVIPVTLGMLLYPFFIQFLQKYQINQTVRVEGPKTHIKKQGTPIMGGLVMLLTIIISSLLLYFFGDQDPSVLFFLLAVTIFGILGFIDDYLIFSKRNNQGIKGRYKFVLQIMIAFGLYLIFQNIGTITTINFIGLSINRYIYVLIFVLVFVSTPNAVNITDGLDGLATGLGIISFLTFAIIEMILGSQVLFEISMMMAATLCAFLMYNLNPAKIFMGDTGSLLIGAALASIAVLSNNQVLLIVIGGVFVIETISVILQVGYFKVTHGKRLFKMSPLHHHFELSGMKETKIVYLFWLIGSVFAVISLVIILLHF